MPTRWTRVSVVLSCSAALLLSPGTAESKPTQARPDLKITAGALTLADGQLTGSVTIKNAGAAKAKASTTSLEVDGAAVQDFTVKAVKQGKARELSMSLPAPAPGTHAVRVCADSGDKVKETKEKNNCRSLGTVTVPPTTTPPPPPPPPPPTTVPNDPISYPINMIFKIGSSPGDYWFHVPAAYDDSHQTPTRLVVFLHGCGDTAPNQLGVIENAANLDFANYLVMAPAIGRDGQCFNLTSDPAQLLAVIADVKTHFNINPKKVVIGGYSSGATLAGRVGFTHAGEFAGVLALIGRPFSNDSDRASALAAAAWKVNVVMVVHTSDTVYPIATAQADRTALVNAGFPTDFTERPGDSSYDTSDVTYLMSRISESWTAP